MQRRPSSLGLAVDSNSFFWTKAINGDKGEYEHKMRKAWRLSIIFTTSGAVHASWSACLASGMDARATNRHSEVQSSSGVQASMRQAKSLARLMELVNCAVQGTNGKELRI